jgi:hypothetical protein
MALATLNGLPFRINPSSIQWGFQIDTAVEDTIGGRVVQVIGATLTDITLAGEYGEKKGFKTDKSHKGLELHGAGLLSWELAEQFLLQVRNMMEEQSLDSRVQGKMHQALDFKFPEFGWHFGVYVKGIDDGQSGQAVMHSPGHFAYQYRISLFIVEERSDALVIPGKRGSSLAERQKAAAINGYISRIASGVGWKVSRFNEPIAVTDAVAGQTHRDPNTAEGTGNLAHGAQPTGQAQSALAGLS